MVLYQYDKIYDFVSGCDPERLYNEITQSAIIATLGYVSDMGTGYVDIYFETSLSGGDVTILDNIIANHDGTSMHPKAEIYDENGNVIYVTDIDDHVTSTSNPHSVTKTDIGLGDVTNEPQLKRSANDFTTFPEKAILHNDDKFLLEAQANGQKCWVRYSNIHTENDGGNGWFVSETVPEDPYLAGGDGWYKPSEDTLYIYEATRGKWLSEDRYKYWFAYNNIAAVNQYIRAWGYMSANSGRGIPIPFDMTLVGIYARTEQVVGLSDIEFRVRKNNVLTDLTTLGIAVGNTYNSDYTLNIDLSPNDYLQCYLHRRCKFPYVVLLLARRGS